jgi:hypothetical protein
VPLVHAAIGSKNRRRFLERSMARPDRRRMAVVAITLAVLLVGQDLVAFVNRPRG